MSGTLSRVCATLVTSLASAGLLHGQDVATLLEDGVAKAEKKEFRAALPLLDAILGKDARHVEALRWRGHCYTGLGMPQKALADLDLAIQLDATNAWAWYARGMAKHELGRAADAIADYTQALERDPRNAKALQWRGYNSSILGDRLGAYLDFTKALERDAENAWLHFARGREAFALGALARAQRDFESATLLAPKDPANHAQLGFVLVARGEDERALSSFDRAYALDPSHQEYVRLWRYWLRSRLGKLTATSADELPRQKWEGDLTKVLLGQLTRATLLLRLSAYGVADRDYEARRCEAAFFLGMRATLLGRMNRARESFKEALVVGDGTMPEWHAARRFAQR